MTDEVKVEVLVDTSKSFANIAKLKQQTDEVTKEAAIKMRETRRSLRQTLNLVGASVDMARTAFRTMGISFTPVGEAVFSFVQSTLTTIYAASIAIGSTGIGLPAAAAMAAAGTYFSGVALATALQNQETIKRGFDDAERMLSSMERFTMSF